MRNADGTVTVTLQDKDGKLLDTYTLNAKTGVGKNASGAEVNLPQTGVAEPYTLCVTAAAFVMTVCGAYLICKSLRKRGLICGRRQSRIFKQIPVYPCTGISFFLLIFPKNYAIISVRKGRGIHGAKDSGAVA